MESRSIAITAPSAAVPIIKFLLLPFTFRIPSAKTGVEQTELPI